MIFIYSIDFSLINGLGKPSVSIYFSGCDIPVKCKECHNPELWGKQEDRVGYDELHRLVESSQSFSKELSISFLGGDPLTPYNREAVQEIARKLKEDFPEAKLILYSWRLPEQIEYDWIKDFNYGVLGQFDIGELIKGYLPASSNQIIYDFKTGKTLSPVKINTI